MTRLALDAGQACTENHDTIIRDLPLTKCQIVAARGRPIITHGKARSTFFALFAIDVHSKLIVSYSKGASGDAAKRLVTDVAGR